LLKAEGGPRLARVQVAIKEERNLELGGKRKKNILFDYFKSFG